MNDIIHPDLHCFGVIIVWIISDHLHEYFTGMHNDSDWLLLHEIDLLIQVTDVLLLLDINQILYQPMIGLCSLDSIVHESSLINGLIQSHIVISQYFILYVSIIHHIPFIFQILVHIWLVVSIHLLHYLQFIIYYHIHY